MKHYVVFTRGILRTGGKNIDHHDYVVDSEGTFIFRSMQDWVSIFEYHNNKLIRRMDGNKFVIFANQPINIEEFAKHCDVEYFLLESFS